MELHTTLDVCNEDTFNSCTVKWSTVPIPAENRPVLSCSVLTLAPRNFWTSNNSHSASSMLALPAEMYKVLSADTRADAIAAVFTVALDATSVFTVAVVPLAILKLKLPVEMLTVLSSRLVSVVVINTGARMTFAVMLLVVSCAVDSCVVVVIAATAVPMSAVPAEICCTCKFDAEPCWKYKAPVEMRCELNEGSPRWVSCSEPVDSVPICAFVNIPVLPTADPNAIVPVEMRAVLMLAALAVFNVSADVTMALDAVSKDPAALPYRRAPVDTCNELI